MQTVEGGTLQLLARKKGLPSAVLLPDMQDILTASGVPCTAPCQQRSVSASSSSSLCVCQEEGKAQLWHHHQMVALPMQGTTQSRSVSCPTTQPHTSSHLPSAKTFLQIWGLKPLRLQHPHPQTHTVHVTLPKWVVSHATFYSVFPVLWERQIT